MTPYGRNLDMILPPVSRILILRLCKIFLVKVFIQYKGNTVWSPSWYVVGSKSFRPDIQKPRQMENAVRDI